MNPQPQQQQQQDATKLSRWAVLPSSCSRGPKSKSRDRVGVSVAKFRVTDTRTPPAATYTSRHAPASLSAAIRSRRLSPRTDINMKFQKAIVQEEKFILQNHWAAYRKTVNTTEFMSPGAHTMMLMMLLAEARRYQRSLHKNTAARGVPQQEPSAFIPPPMHDTISVPSPFPKDREKDARARLDIVPLKTFKSTVSMTVDAMEMNSINLSDPTNGTLRQGGRARPVSSGGGGKKQYQETLLELARCLFWDPL